MFKKISPYDLTDNVFKLLDKDWMLVTAGKKEDFNTMTASWGHLGIMWNLPVAICYIRPQRYTFDFVNRNEDYTLSFFPESSRKMLQFCGTKSGRDYDKVKETGLLPLETEAGNFYFEQARLVLECKKIYQDEMKPANFVRPEIAKKVYPKNDFHRFYFGEITNAIIHA
ncbi:MAG: flavin reductase [Spirochaetales bacterium]|jgi:flavin reductase (DIM6/NTAB) family NADH-FMN oxidoreductase RutF|nr:flavin reductase [Spirochaetales bacterium]